MIDVLLTGASSGIGRAIATKLDRDKYRIICMGRDFDGTDLPDNCVICQGDLLDSKWLDGKLAEIDQKYDIKVLINNAGCAYYGLHEEISADKISQIIRTNLEIPMVLTQHYLRKLKACRGSIINIASVTATERSPHAAAYGASKSGLLSFGRSIFDEARKYGVKVTTIMPDMTDTQLYRNADFECSDEQGAALSADNVADAVNYCIEQPAGVVTCELMLRPQLMRIKRKR